MKDFHIKQPRGADRSAAVVGYEYDRVSKRTRTVYLGSVCIDGNPDRPEQALRLLNGKVLNSQPVEATAGNLEVVRDWLERHGSYRQQQLALEKKKKEVQRAREEHERQQLERITAELREKFEAEWRAEFEAARGEEADPLDAADVALSRAAEYVRSEATALKARGEHLTRLRSVGQDAGRCALALDRLQARANRLRLAQVGAFTAACQDAGLMERKRRAAKRNATVS